MRTFREKSDVNQRSRVHLPKPRMPRILAQDRWWTTKATLHAQSNLNTTPTLISPSQKIILCQLWTMTMMKMKQEQLSQTLFPSMPKLLLVFLVLLQQVRVCYGQQKPNATLQTYAFDSTIPSFRQNFCTRYHDVAEGRMNIQDAIRGLSINAVLGGGEYFNLDPTTMAIPEGYPGLAAVLMDEICDRAGCSWRDTFATVNGPGEDRTWTDLIAWTTEKYDLSMDWWMQSIERMTLGMAFTEPWYDASIIMVMRKTESGRRLDLWTWLYPFENSVWFLILATIPATGLVYLILEKLDDRSDKRRLDGDPIEASFMIAISMTGQWIFEPRTHAARLLTFSAAFFALVLGATYTANLASFLVVTHQPPSQYDKVEDVVRANLPMCITRGTQTYRTISAAFPLANIIRRHDEQDVLQGVRDGDCDVAVTTVTSWNENRRNASLTDGCRMEWVGRVFENIPAGIATVADSGRKCTNLLRDVVTIHMAQMRSDGFLQDAWDEHLTKTTKNQCEQTEKKEEEEEDTGQLKISHMSGIFAFHAILTLSAVFIALVSKCSEIRKDNVKRKNSLKGKRKTSTTVRFDATRRITDASMDLPTFHENGLYSSDEEDDNDDDGASSIFSDIELEQIRREVRRMSVVQDRNMMMVDEKFETLMTAISRLDENRNSIYERGADGDSFNGNDSHRSHTPTTRNIDPAYHFNDNDCVTIFTSRHHIPTQQVSHLMSSSMRKDSDDDPEI